MLILAHVVVSVFAIAPATDATSGAASGAAFGAALVPGDCNNCKPDKLCLPHLDQEKKALDELKPKLKSSKQVERVEAVNKIADLTKEHANAPSRNVAQVLATALKDKDREVQAVAAERFVQGQHPDEAVKALVDALDDVRELFAKLDYSNKQNPEAKLGKDGMRYVNAVIDGLGQLPDDRGVAALAALLTAMPSNTPAALVEPVATSLAKLDTREAARVLIARMTAAEGSRGHSGNSRGAGGGGAGGGGGGAGGGGAGGGGAGGGGAGGGRPGGRGQGARGDEERAKGDDDLRHALHNLLLGIAQKHHLTGTPDYDDQADSKWRDWLDKYEGKLPAKAGHLGAEPLKTAK